MLHCVAILAVGLILAAGLFLLRGKVISEWQRQPTVPANADSQIRNARKPDWVKREVIRLAAWSPGLSCRVLAEVFNRQFANDRRMTVGKTFVATLLRQRRAEILRLRRSLKHRIPRPQPRNRIWALDLTGKTDLVGRQRLILGLLDHGTRAAVVLREIADKRSLTILRELIIAFRKYGLPRMIRVDNEACFSSQVLHSAMQLLGVRLQHVAPHCPWMNGRIERLFGTLKRHLDLITVTGVEDLAAKLLTFRLWYNHVRPHQHLYGRTPAEAWSGRPKAYGMPVWFEAWDERLTGWYFQPP
ncbi:MAG: transposase family protein [Proteobacteria bacterium]|nr:transposase family protein [Pseudomonadota bacterium]